MHNNSAKYRNIRQTLWAYTVFFTYQKVVKTLSCILYSLFILFLTFCASLCFCLCHRHITPNPWSGWSYAPPLTTTCAYLSSDTPGWEHFLCRTRLSRIWIWISCLDPIVAVPFDTVATATVVSVPRRTTATTAVVAENATKWWCQYCCKCCH